MRTPDRSITTVTAAAGSDVNSMTAPLDLTRIQRAPLYRIGINVTKTSAPAEQRQQLPAGIGAPIPERHTTA